MHLYAAQTYMPKTASDEDKHSALSILPISTQTSFYLPGLEELLRSDRRTLLLAMVHAAVGFASDVVTIYATMWFSEPSDHEFSRRGESLTAGLLYGSISLMIFTVVNTLKIHYRYLQLISYFKVSLLAAAVLSLLAFCRYDYLSFYLLCGSVAVVNQFYRHSVLSQ